MTTQEEIKNTLSFITQVLSADVLPYFNSATHQYSVTDMSEITSKFLILQQSIVNLEGTFDQKIALIESPIIREIDVLENCQTVIIPDLDILAHGGSYEIELISISASATASLLKFLLNDDALESLYRIEAISGTTAVTAGQYSYASLGHLYGSYHCHSVANFMLNEFGQFYYQGCSGSYGGSSIFTRNFTGLRIGAIGNITSLTIYSDVANGIGAGSKIIIRRKDV